jgi:hypothetical protein
MRKSKAITVIRKRKRSGGLVPKQNVEEHPLSLAVRAATAFLQGTMVLMKTIMEAEDPDAVIKQFEEDGLIKLQQETGEKINAAIKEIGDRMSANHTVLPEPSPDSADCPD